jgi:hypothetical protein
MSHHPTILIGYGAYGLSVLHRFLAGAAARGALLWDHQTSVGSLNERTLHSLSLLWIRDTFEFDEQRVPDDLLDQSGYELMDDLYAQVREVTGATADEVKSRLPEMVEAEKKRLLDAFRRNEARMPGLDVIVLAQPTREEIVGWLRDLIEPVMIRLAEDPGFAVVAEGAGDSLLNFIEILDFDNYWAPEMGPVRLTLQLALQQHDEGLGAGRPTLGRVYFFDGNTPAGRRPPESRIEEVVLLLELLLLEGLRDSPDTRSLYRRERVGISPVGTIGIRVVERSSGLLRRLAAAGFAQGWLAYVVSAPADTHSQTLFRELAEPFRGERLKTTVGEESLRVATAEELERVTEALLRVPINQPDWGGRLRKEAQQQTESAVLKLSRQNGAQSARLNDGVLKEFREALQRAIGAAIEDGAQPATLGAVIERLGAIDEEFGSAVMEAAPPAGLETASDQVFEEADRMQREYRTYVDRQVQAAQMARRWWPRAAVLFAVASVPMLLRGLAALGLDDALPEWAQVLLSAILMGGLFWWFGNKAVQPHIADAAERARNFYIDSGRGRLAERIRQVARSALVAGRIESHSRLLAFGLKQYACGVVAGEIQRARQMLIRRRNELEWLRRQLGEFLVSYQVDARQDPPVFQEGRVLGSVRYSLETDDDLAAIAQSLPRTTGRFPEMVKSSGLFNDWPQPYSDTFLHPVPFLDGLSGRFQDRLEIEEGESRRRASRVASFLEHEVHVPVCFHWWAADGLPAPERGSLFPAAWKSMPGVFQALAIAGFGKRIVETPNTERLYLFESLLGVPKELLVRTK